MKQTLPRRALSTLLLICALQAAHAGFIDERTSPAADAAPAAAQAPAKPVDAAQAARAAALASVAPAGLIPAGENRPYYLVGGKPIHTQLIDWAKSSGWTLKWSPENTWEAFADTTIIAPSADRAVEQVIQNLRREGKPIRLRVYAGNRVMEIEALTIGE